MSEQTSYDEERDVKSNSSPRDQRGQSTIQQGTTSVPLLDGEEILIDERPAWSAWSVHLIVAGLVFLGSTVSDALLFGVLGAGLIVGYVWYQRTKVTYVVTDRRVVIVTGHSSKSTNETWMEDVRGMQTGASALERLLGHGHITISHAVIPTGIGRFTGLTLGGVANYEEIASVIRQRQSERKGGAD
ncbi:PH domain-containing protein [Haloterrigena alkaliphila]|uniref:PH domain-containing protein n=1 Tax=Haloterrigena alkaliphila TaxID=2816475 RepID=A0A8A2VJA8_9EURY|nr:PH domain-containing protein [Haloterrigena alkaliphila]QSX00781.1 PH domain-containing protein [Haloterrigena alkaliphila]